MKKIIFITILGLLFGCQTEIKNPKPKIFVEEGTKIEVSESLKERKKRKHEKEANEKPKLNDRLLGFWVGYFENDDSYGKNIYVDEGYFWNRGNKINISISRIEDSLVYGHSVVAGNDRPFKGTMKRKDNTYSFLLKEPGDHKYDGEFIFVIKNDELIGKWTAFNDIDIKKRKYNLKRKPFNYNPNINLEKSKEYVNWNKLREEKFSVEYEDGELEEWVSREFASATDLIYKINASNSLLTSSQVENLRKGDLSIIRNTIYARHGYSFKNRPLRVFFDAQSWYIPVHTNIKDDFTELEKKNIQLLLKYEKNASEYYDYFGRG